MSIPLAACGIMGDVTSATSTTGLWPASTSTGLNATVAVPGSKSQTNRALVLAAQAGAESHIHGGLRSRDTDLMADALRTLGTGITEHGDGSWTVTPGPLTGPATLDCGLAGTVMRFLPPLAATAAETSASTATSRHGAVRCRSSRRCTLGVRVDEPAMPLPFAVHADGPGRRHV